MAWYGKYHDRECRSVCHGYRHFAYKTVGSNPFQSSPEANPWRAFVILPSSYSPGRDAYVVPFWILGLPGPHLYTSRPLNPARLCSPVAHQVEQRKKRHGIFGIYYGMVWYIPWGRLATLGSTSRGSAPGRANCTVPARYGRTC